MRLRAGGLKDAPTTAQLAVCLFLLAGCIWRINPGGGDWHRHRQSLSVGTFSCSSSPVLKNTRATKVVFSTHSCIGGGFTVDAWKHRTCHFKNLYLVGRRWYYVTEKNVTSETELRESFTVSLSPNNNKIWELPKFAPTFISETDFLVYLESERLDLCGGRWETRPTFYFTEYNGQNFGHVIGDTLFPIYQGLHTFGLMHVSDNVACGFRDIVALEDMTGSSERPWTCQWMRSNNFSKHGGFQMCDKFRKQLRPLLTNNFQTICEEANDGFSSQLTIYQDLVAGSGNLADHCDDRTLHGKTNEFEITCNQGRERLWYDFAQALMRRVALPVAERKVLNILIWDRQDKRRTNLATFTNETLPALLSQSNMAVSVRRITRIEELTLQEQIQIFASTAIYIGPPGGGSFLTLFMPKGSTGIRISPNSKDCHLDWHVFNYVSQTHSVYICSPNGLADSISENLRQQVLFGIRRFEVMSS